MDGFEYIRAASTFVKALVAMVCMCVGVIAIMPRITGLQDIVKCIIGGTTGCIIYVLVLIMLKEKLIMHMILTGRNKLLKLPISKWGLFLENSIKTGSQIQVQAV